MSDQNHNIQDLPGRRTKSIGSPLKLCTAPLFKRLQPKESYSDFCSSSNQMTYKAQPTYFLMTPLLVTSFVWPQKKKAAVSEEKRHCCYCTEEVHNFFLPANGKEWVLISPNSVGNLALTKSQSFLQVLSCQQKGVQISGVLVTVCCSSISFLFKRFFFFVYF